MAEGKRVVRQYPVEFKIDAVELAEKKGYGITEAARSLGIAESNIHKWRWQYREGRLVAGHKRAQPTADEAELLEKVKAVFEKNKGRYGSPRVHIERAKPAPLGLVRQVKEEAGRLFLGAS